MTPRDPAASELTEIAIREAAARWVVRRDRGFTGHEAVDFERWLSADPRHVAAIARSALAWKLLDRMPVQMALPVAAKSRRPGRRWLAVGGLAAVVGVTFFYGWGWPQLHELRSRPGAMDATTPVRSLASQTRVLTDGTFVRLNANAALIEDFTAKERRVRLMSGEAFFMVTKDPTRPFIVEAREVTVRAVGTAFNVQLQDRTVDVLVTEGTVLVKPPATTGKSGSAPGGLVETNFEGHQVSSSAPFVVAGQRAVVALAAPTGVPPVVISKVSSAELATARAWGETFMRLGGATLAELTAEFQRQTGIRVIFADPVLADLRVGGRFPGDNVEDFIRILDENYGITSRRGADGTLILGKTP